MTYKQIASMVSSIGLPYAYYQFPEGTAQAPPFVVFFYADTDDVFADDTNYQRIATLNIELYTSEKDFSTESTVEQILKNNNLTYYKEENYIDSEQMWQIAYEMEVIING
jgi:hypothetical protein